MTAAGCVVWIKHVNLLFYNCRLQTTLDIELYWQAGSGLSISMQINKSYTKFMTVTVPICAFDLIQELHSPTLMVHHFCWLCSSILLQTRNNSSNIYLCTPHIHKHGERVKHPRSRISDPAKSCKVPSFVLGAFLLWLWGRKWVEQQLWPLWDIPVRASSLPPSLRLLQ